MSSLEPGALLTSLLTTLDGAVRAAGAVAHTERLASELAAPCAQRAAPDAKQGLGLGLGLG
jgi:hypothetical protein